MIGDIRASCFLCTLLKLFILPEFSIQKFRRFRTWMQALLASKCWTLWVFGALSYGMLHVLWGDPHQPNDVMSSYRHLHTVQIASSVYVSIWLGRVWSNLFFAQTFFFVPFQSAVIRVMQAATVWMKHLWLRRSLNSHVWEKSLYRLRHSPWWKQYPIPRKSVAPLQ